MEKEIKNKSPFYVEYTGTTKNTKTYGYHVRKDFEKPLKEFFDIRFGSDAKDTEIMEYIIQDFYFRYAHERNSYGKTILAIMHKDEFKSAKPKIIPLTIIDRFPKDNEHGVIIDDEMIDNYNIMQFIAYNTKFSDVDSQIESKIINQIFDDGFQTIKYKTFDKLKELNKDKLKDFFVLEIPLNNYLDSENNGVYCFIDDNIVIDEMLHIGLAIVKDNDKDVNANPFPIIYFWKLSDSFEIEVLQILKMELRELEIFCEKRNFGMLSVLNFFNISEFGVDYKLKQNRKEQAILDYKLKQLKIQEQELIGIKDAELNDDE